MFKRRTIISNKAITYQAVSLLGTSRVPAQLTPYQEYRRYAVLRPHNAGVGLLDTRYDKMTCVYHAVSQLEQLSPSVVKWVHEDVAAEMHNTISSVYNLLTTKPQNTRLYFVPSPPDAHTPYITVGNPQEPCCSYTLVDVSTDTLLDHLRDALLRRTSHYTMWIVTGTINPRIRKTILNLKIPKYENPQDYYAQYVNEIKYLLARGDTPEEIIAYLGVADEYTRVRKSAALEYVKEVERSKNLNPKRRW